MADALQHGHDQQVVHRDIKPENMLVGHKGDILLSDFGIATMLQNARPEAEQKIIGTASYMSPEQFQGQAFPASDQYALAIIAYEWLVGECPFKGSVSTVASQHLHEPPSSLCQRNPQIPPTLEQVVFKALAKHPAQRYTTATEFANAFAAASPQQALVLRNPVIYAGMESASANNDQTTFIALEQSQQVYGQPMPQKQRGGLSRRAVIGGLAAITAVGIAGSAGAWAASHSGLFSPAPNKAGTSVIAKAPTAAPTAAPAPGKLITTYTEHSDMVTTIAWMPGNNTTNNAIIASGSKDSSVHVWRFDTRADIRVYTGNTDVVEAIAWSPDGQLIASASDDDRVRVWTALQDGENHTYHHHSRNVTAVSWSPDGQKIASGSRDSTVRLWNPQNSNSTLGVFDQHNSDVLTVSWSPDGQKIASGGNDSNVLVWNPNMVIGGDNGNNGDQSVLHNFNHNDSVTAVAWSPTNNQWLASASQDKTVRIWSLNGGDQAIITYHNHTDAVRSIAWSPDGQKIASASDDGTVQIWKVSDGSHIFTYNGHNGNAVQSVAWSVDGKYLASGGADKTVQIWTA
jgi:WD40 repeat protein